MATCATCSKPPTADSSLQRCSKCKAVSYCNRECQKADWKTHKQNCSRLAGENVPEASTSTSALGTASASAKETNGDGPHSKPFHAIKANRYLHGRPELQTFKLLVDCLRLRQEDEYNLDGDHMEGSIYDGESATSAEAFREFISQAKEVKGLLPPWLTDAKIEECIKWAQDEGNPFCLAFAQEKSDIQETWADHAMPMKLRMVAEKVYGYAPGGFSGEQMMDMHLAMEAGTFPGANMFRMG